MNIETGAVTALKLGVQEAYDSAMYELSNALSGLAGAAIDINLEAVDGMATGLGNSGYLAKSISEKFADVNKTISSAWNDVSKFSYSVDEMVSSLIFKFINEMKVFVEKTEFNETEIARSANTANELAEQIINGLKTSFNGIYNDNK